MGPQFIDLPSRLQEQHQENQQHQQQQQPARRQQAHQFHPPRPPSIMAPAAPPSPIIPTHLPQPARMSTRLHSTGNSVSNLAADRYDHDELSIVASDEGSSSHDSEPYPQNNTERNFFRRKRRGRRNRRHHEKANAPKTSVVQMVKKETSYVNKLRFVLLGFMLVIAIVFAVLTWRLAVTNTDGTNSKATNRNADADTDQLFDSFVDTIDWSSAVQSKLSKAFTLSAYATSYVLDSAAAVAAATNDANGPNDATVTAPTLRWPEVTIPNMEAIATGILQTSTASLQQFWISPLVTVNDRSQFEQYAVQQQQITCDILGCEVVTQIDTDNVSTTPTDFLNPVWQIVPQPITTSPILLDDQYSTTIQKVIQDRAAVFDQPVTTTTTAATDTDTPTTPTTTLHYPIYQTFQQGTIVAILSMPLSLQALLEYSIQKMVHVMAQSDGHDDINVAVMTLKSVCDSDATEHHFKVHANGKVQSIDSLPTNDIRTDKEEILVLPISYLYSEFQEPLSQEDPCNFQLHVFPTNQLYDVNNSNSDDGTNVEAIVYPILAVVLLIILGGIFFMFDWYMEKRFSTVVNVATKATTVVENLFPEQFRDRMMQNTMESKNNATTAKNNAASPNEPSGNGMDAMNGNNNGNNNNGNGNNGTNGSGGVLKNGNDNNAGGAMKADDANNDNNRNKKSNNKKDGKKNMVTNLANAPVSVKQFLSNMSDNVHDLSTQPIADLFQNTTVLFADIAGFTAWSSQREPPQVFTLLETLYRSFDVITAKSKVFKVETIGDCYMAVTGLPNPDPHHAVHMTRFAYQCVLGMKELIKELEAILGPGTSDLALRVGCHSGPVTAGVLRGEKSRFQLFGDTVNTASRMESTGERGRIQVSQETADLLIAAGKSHWLKPRDGVVIAKGKGELKTFWLEPAKRRRATKGNKEIREINVQNSGTSGQGDGLVGSVVVAHSDLANPTNDITGEPGFDDKYKRLIDWNVEVLLHHLARVISTRSRSPPRGSLVNHSSEAALPPSAVNDVAEVVALPPFDSEAAQFRRAHTDITMMQETRADLHEYIKRIAVMYRDVPFHNFEHASHVTLCANKLLNRLVNSDEYESEEALHDATFGISSDPLAHFAIVFAALIHDVDHTGLPNAQLVKDQHEVALKFDNKSVAEQNSVHIGWEMLMDPRFERLRKCIYQTNVERKRFRQLVINCVLATDIADRQVNDERQYKWDKAFRRRSTLPGQPGAPGIAQGSSTLQLQEDMNRKATAVIEHIIQVSDVAHTMQHWHIYRRWNERLFHEMHNAFTTSHVNVDPSANWYIGELGFFDYYLIPLAMKLKECGVFGGSGYEYISYVLKNKKEWERKGRQVVEEMILMYKDVEDEELSDEFESGSDFDSDDIGYDSPGELSSSSGDDDDDDDYDDRHHPQYDPRGQNYGHHDDEGSSSGSGSSTSSEYDGDEDEEDESLDDSDYGNYRER